MRVVQDSIFNSDAKYICHQCNCVTNRAAHLAAAVFHQYPYADIYSARSGHHIPGPGEQMGNIIVRGNGVDQRFVIAMLAQYFPGKYKFPDSKMDGIAARQKAFKNCLDKISQISDLHSISFPYLIGCGAAGGDWGVYLNMIQQFSNSLPDVDVSIYKIE